jgi:hypothetical protein
MICSACALPGGATIYFSIVRRLSAGGMIALSELLLALIPLSVLPQMRGMEAFVASIESAVKSGQGTKEMQDFMVAYRRFLAAHPREQDDTVVAAVA